VSDCSHQQDLYVESLTKNMEKLTEQMDVYESQVKGQAEDTRAFRLLQTEVSVTSRRLRLSPFLSCVPPVKELFQPRTS